MGAKNHILRPLARRDKFAKFIVECGKSLGVRTQDADVAAELDTSLC